MARFAKPTYVDPTLLQKGTTTRRYKFLLKNHKTLLKVLRALTSEQHDQTVWARDNSRNICGSSACALGWAALSGEIDGLQYYTFKDRHKTQYAPAINGGWVSHSYIMRDPKAYPHAFKSGPWFWPVAGKAFFGTTSDGLFNDGLLSLAEVIEGISDRIRMLQKYIDGDTKRYPE